VNGTPAPKPRNMKVNYPIKPAGFPDPGIFPKGAPYNEDHWGPMRVPAKGDVIGLTLANLEQWRVFIAREGHSVRVDEQGRILIDGVPTSAYTVQRNYIFGMGDNRDNSLDSRFWGFIPDENIVGSPMIVYWSWDPNIPIYNVFGKLSTVRLARIGTIIR
jgi:signal peptidase I